ncbi:MAG: prepilin-type N-terminal cleavage/methylation domain-containing protein [Lentisphaeria bacterium]|jgi:prepilin-type N-terminal cleavage/methylation domain-containing protein
MTRKPFTLVEMLVVIAIAAFLLGIAVPVFERLAVGGGVDAGARMVGAQLRLARQCAIANREHVALVMPAAASGTGADKSFVGLRPAIIDASRNWLAWVPNSKWDFMPPGTVIGDIDGTNGIPAGDLTGGTGSAVTVSGADGLANGSYRAVAFKPNGRLSGSGTQLYVSVVEGFYPALATKAEPRRRDNVLNIEIDQYTGRISHQ